MKKTVSILFLLLMMLLSGCGRRTPAENSLQVYFFGAGKADAILLTTNDGAVLIDAGEKGFGKEIVSYLQEQDIDALDYLILTHFDKDHVGGAAKVLREIPVKNVLQSNFVKDSSEYDQYAAALASGGIEPVTLREVFEFTLGGVSFSVDPPAREEYDEDPSNNSSLIISVRAGDCGLLFPGDAEKDRLKEWMDGHSESYRLVKLPHHGAWSKSLSRFFSLTGAHYAVITSSDAEPEDPRTVAFLEERSIETYYTRVAPVILIWDGSKLTVQYDH